MEPTAADRIAIEQEVTACRRAYTVCRQQADDNRRQLNIARARLECLEITQQQLDLWLTERADALAAAIRLDPSAGVPK